MPLRQALAARADGVNAVASIAPVHSLLARVMEGAGRPRLLVTGGRSPHGTVLKPSDARALATARQNRFFLDSVKKLEIQIGRYLQYSYVADGQ